MTAEIGWESGLGTAIQLRRVELGMARKDLASRAGVSYPFLSEIEKGTKQPSSRKLGQLAEALGMGTEELVTISKRLCTGTAESPSILTSPEFPSRVSAARTPGPGKSVPAVSQPAVLPSTKTTAGPSDAAESDIEATEMRSIVESAVSDTLRIWSRDVLPLLVEREVQRALDSRHGTDGR